MDQHSEQLGRDNRDQLIQVFARSAHRLAALLLVVWLVACAIEIPIQTLPDAPCAGTDVGAFRLLTSSGALVLESEDRRRFHPIWPAGSTAEVRDGRAVVLDSTGSIIAQEGQLLQIGGGAQENAATVMVCSVLVIDE